MNPKELEELFKASGEDYKRAFNDGINTARDVVEALAGSDGWVEERAANIVAQLYEARK